jgi:hypothetical protein
MTVSFFEQSPQILRQNLRACSEKNVLVALYFSLARPSDQRGSSLYTQIGDLFYINKAGTHTTMKT